MELTPDVVPRVRDGEVGEIYLKTAEEVVQTMRNGEFKLTCNVTYLAFLTRHGYVTAENVPDLVELCSRLHRNFDLFIT